MLTDKQKKLIKNLKSVKFSAKTRTEYNAYQQMLTRIRKFGYGAVGDLLFLTEELPEEEIKKVITKDRIEELINIILNSTKDLKHPVGILTADGQTGQIGRVYTQEEVEELKRFEVLEPLIQRLIKQLQKAIVHENDLKAMDELIKEYDSFTNLQTEIFKLNYELRDCLSKKSLLEDFIKNKSKMEEFESWKENILRKSLKESGLSEERINNYFKRDH